MSAELGTTPEPVGWIGNRNIIVPPDVIPVRRVSPIPKKKRTLCRPRPDGEPVCRAGNREWFSDRLFVDSQVPDLPTACGTSMTAHASCLVGLIILLAGQPIPTAPLHVNSPLRMPAFVAVGGAGGAGSAQQLTVAVPERRAAPQANPRVAKADTPKKSAVVSPRPAAANAVANNEQREDSADAPTERNDDDAQASASEDATGEADATGSATGGEGSGDGGRNGDVAGGGGTGTAGVGGGSSGVGMSPGPYRLGNGIEPPRKIKDVAPIYPAGALASRTLGAVIIEVLVGADGKVHDAKVLHSIPSLDQAALEAVRQWEFAPSRLNGVPVAVIVTVLVQFSIY